MPRPPKYAPAVFVARVAEGTDFSELINDLKAYTWTTEREHAVLELQSLGQVIVRGGSHGISLILRPSALVDPLGQPIGYPCILFKQQPVRVNRLLVHTHPSPTGPSDGDFRVLELLSQQDSILYEIGGASEGTRFHRKAVARDAGKSH